jgi:MoxR-like ATPase
MYAFVDYPSRETEIAILAARCPGIEARLAAQIVGFVQSVRKEDLEKKPGVAEMLDFAAALAGLGVNDLSADPAILHASLATLLKTRPTAPTSRPRSPSASRGSPHDPRDPLRHPR